VGFPFGPTVSAKNVLTKSGIRSTLSFVVIFSSSRLGWVSYLSVFLRSPGAKKGYLQRNSDD